MKKHTVLLATLAVWVAAGTVYGQPGMGYGPPPGNYPPTIPAMGGPQLAAAGMPMGAGPMGPGPMGPGPMGPGMPMPGGPMPGGAPMGPMEMPEGPPVGTTPWQNPFSAEETACWTGDCGCCSQCCRGGLLWADVEFLLWWGKGSHVPPLVTSSNDPLVTRADAGVLGVPSTTILFGNQLLGDQMQAGGRATLGLWLDPQQNTGIATRYTQLEGDNETFRATSDGSTVLARPFFNQLLGQQDALLIGFTDPITGPVATGSVFAQYKTEFLASETYGRFMLERDRKKRIDFILGYHFFRFDNFLTVNSLSTSQEFPLTGTMFNVSDRFDTENEFHGGMAGLMGSYANGRWALNWTAKLSYGSSRQAAEISGQTTITPTVGAPVTSAGGLLAQPSNSGVFERSQGVFVPELTLNLMYHASPNWSFGVGYNYMWISSMLQSGEIIDTHVDLSQTLVPPRPAFRFNDTDYWFQGVNFTAMYNY